MRISVAMCTFNGAAYLGAQLETIAGQTRLPDELVVSDDRSTDDSVEVVEKFAAEAPFPVDVTVVDRHLGSTRNYERVIQRCSGDLIVLCDQDDVWLPQKLERIEHEFARADRVGLAFSDAYLMNADGQPTGRRLWDIAGFNASQRVRMRRDPLGVLLGRSIVSGCTLAFRSRYRPLLVPFPPERAAPRMRLIHDRWISLVLAAASEVAVVDEPLVGYRIHRRQQVGIPRLQVRMVVPQSVLRFRQVAVPHPLMLERLEATLGHLETVRDRLVSAPGAEARGAAVARLDDAIAHTRTRAALPAGRTGRVPGVLRELTSGRYHRYSLGFASAVADLARSPAERPAGPA
ncbi:MAG TPA: glycosyltransferase family 2 protein [Actinomycetota bacterium]|nr:glycosyltransferase family 2 protein [Actinomycetota bacterium]